MRGTSRPVVALLSSFLFFPPALPDETGPSRFRDLPTSVTQLIEKGKERISAGKFQDAAVAFGEALALSRDSKSLKDQALCLINLGVTAWDLGEILKSGGYFAEALPIAQRLGSDSDGRFCQSAMEIVRLYNLGKEQRSANQNQKSLEAFERAIALGGEIGLEDFELKCLRQKSLTYWQMNDFESFFACNKRGLEISKRIKHQKELGRCLNNMGAYFGKLNDYSNALRYLEEALPVIISEKDEDTQSECLNNIGMVYADIGDFDSALYYMSNALEIDQKIGTSLSISIDLENLGSIYLKKGWATGDTQDLRKALEQFNLSFDKQEPGSEFNLETVLLNNCGFAHYLLGEYELSLMYLSKALRTSKYRANSEEQCHIFNNVARIYHKMGNLERAGYYYLKSISHGDAAELSETSWEAYFGLGQCCEEQKSQSAALAYYKKSISMIEQVRSRITLDSFKIGFARDKFVVYQHALGILYRLYSEKPSLDLLEDFFLIMEKAKARAFLESLLEARVDTIAPLDPTFVGRRTDLSRDITVMSKELHESGLSATAKEARMQELALKEEKYMRLISDMRTGKGRIGLSFSPEISSIARVQKEYLDGRSALLEYSVGEDRSYLLFITSSDAQLFELPGRSVLEDSLKGYLKSLSFPSHGPFMGAAASERISRALIFPLQCASQKNVDTLIIVPDGILHFLPFETLKVISEGKATYLIEKYKVSYCLSATSLSILRQKTSDRTVTKYLLAFGAPVIQETNAPSDDREKSRTEIWREIYTRDGFSFSSLPFSKKEVNTISRYFPEERRDIFIEKGASEAALKNLPLGEYEIIHFACHGFLDKRYCFRSALVLSPDAQQDEDGFLQAREIYGLRMDAKLVVLSACQSGNGALENGEGLVGLTRTFFYAGAHSVLSSIWSVNDESTAGLMDNFYASLVQGLNTSGALREAKLQMLNSTRSHPFYWAGFLLNGDAAQIQFRGLKAQKVN